MSDMFKKGEAFKSFMELMQYISTEKAIYDSGTLHAVDMEYDDIEISEYYNHFATYAPAIKIEEEKPKKLYQVWYKHVDDDSNICSEFLYTSKTHFIQEHTEHNFDFIRLKEFKQDGWE